MKEEGRLEKEELAELIRGLSNELRIVSKCFKKVGGNFVILDEKNKEVAVTNVNDQGDSIKKSLIDIGAKIFKCKQIYKCSITTINLCTSIETTLGDIGNNYDADQVGYLQWCCDNLLKVLSSAKKEIFAIDTSLTQQWPRDIFCRPEEVGLRNMAKLKECGFDATLYDCRVLSRTDAYEVKNGGISRIFVKQLVNDYDELIKDGRDNLLDFRCPMVTYGVTFYIGVLSCLCNPTAATHQPVAEGYQVDNQYQSIIKTCLSDLAKTTKIDPSKIENASDLYEAIREKEKEKDPNYHYGVSIDLMKEMHLNYLEKVISHIKSNPNFKINKPAIFKERCRYVQDRINGMFESLKDKRRESIKLLEEESNIDVVKGYMPFSQEGDIFVDVLEVNPLSNTDLNNYNNPHWSSNVIGNEIFEKVMGKEDVWRNGVCRDIYSNVKSMFLFSEAEWLSYKSRFIEHLITIDNSDKKGNEATIDLFELVQRDYDDYRFLKDSMLFTAAGCKFSEQKQMMTSINQFNQNNSLDTVTVEVMSKIIGLPMNKIGFSPIYSKGYIESRIKELRLENDIKLACDGCGYRILVKSDRICKLLKNEPGYQEQMTEFENNCTKYKKSWISVPEELQEGMRQRRDFLRRGDYSGVIGDAFVCYNDEEEMKKANKKTNAKLITLGSHGKKNEFVQIKLEKDEKDKKDVRSDVVKVCDSIIDNSARQISQLQLFVAILTITITIEIIKKIIQAVICALFEYKNINCGFKECLVCKDFQQKLLDEFKIFQIPICSCSWQVLNELSHMSKIIQEQSAGLTDTVSDKTYLASDGVKRGARIHRFAQIYTNKHANSESLHSDFGCKLEQKIKVGGGIRI